MSCLLHMSDPHFGTEQPDVVRALATLVRTELPSALVLSGDITQRATRAQFARARAFVDSLANPGLLAIPGNHDIPLFALSTRMMAPYARYRAAFGDELEPVVDVPDFLVVGVNTTRWYRHENGAVSAQQAERAARRLAKASARQLRIVVVHQPVAVTREEDHKNLLIGREEAVRLWAEAEADLVLGGHIHLPFVLPLHEGAGGPVRRMWCVQAGTAVSTRLRAGAPNSVNLIRFEGGDGERRCTVEQWDCDAGDAQFRRARVHSLALGTTRPRP
ncbi:Calcineurin-like phosphoesterase superfamily domain protein [Variovorax sp. PBL-H6]|uniref:metallophosphoesterase family protein n=1 Tax=Variovorax sp. PBL-H6 TaxID=434009 RepID=UPI001318532C|nr:metallophosphoesterase [Variovorax sp. PBL-H6]VTU23257.1 Calcineurin-like phosphoesterase superfamily domain protein [Variovorax sp. PBL-H6]